MKKEDKIMLSRGSMHYSHKVQIFMGGNHVTPVEEIVLNADSSFCNSFMFNKELDIRATEGDYDYYLTPAQYRKWRKGIEDKITKIIK